LSGTRISKRPNAVTTKGVDKVVPLRLIIDWMAASCTTLEIHFEISQDPLSIHIVSTMRIMDLQ